MKAVVENYKEEALEAYVAEELELLGSTAKLFPLSYLVKRWGGDEVNPKRMERRIKDYVRSGHPAGFALPCVRSSAHTWLFRPRDFLAFEFKMRQVQYTYPA